MVLDFGVVADVGIVVEGEEVDENPVYDETQGQAEEDGLGVQELHDVLG